MGSVYWLIEKRVIILQPSGEITEQAIQDNFEHVSALMHDGSEPMYLIIDSTAQTGSITPQSAQRLAQAVRQNLSQWKDHNFKFTVLITTNMLVRFAMSLLVQWIGSNMRAFDSSDEAIKFLMRVDPTLPSST